MFNFLINFWTLIYIIVGAGLLGIGIYIYFSSKKTTSTHKSNDMPEWMKLLLTAVGIDKNTLEEYRKTCRLASPYQNDGEIRRAKTRLSGIAHSIRDECIESQMDDDFIEEDDEIIKQNHKAKKTEFQEFGHSVFKEMISKFGGNPENVIEKIKIRDTTKNSDNSYLSFDSYYSDGTHSLGVDYHGMKHSIFPNPFHISKTQFNKQLEIDENKKRIALNNGIYLINVPYTVYSCVKDKSSVTGWKWVKGMDKEIKSKRIEAYLQSSLIDYCKNMLEGV